MLISHFWYTFSFESAYKKPSFIKVATFFLMYFSIKLSDLQSKGDNKVTTSMINICFSAMFAHGSASLQLFPVVWIFLRSLGVICYDR